MNAGKRRGILAAGNFIVDRIRRIDSYPEENMLANIESETQSNGGGAYNVLRDLAALGVDYPLAAAGRIGNDTEGCWILEDCRSHGIGTEWLIADETLPTSYTEVMSVSESGRRTFFHRRGANANFDGAQIDFTACSARMFHLAYLLLLDRLDAFADDGRSHASHLLERATASGMITSIDIVSTENPRFREIVVSALPCADHLFINEVECSRVLGKTVDPLKDEEIAEAARALLAFGVRRSVVLHTEYGAVSVRPGQEDVFQNSVCVPSEKIRGANGAGDAFAAGYLHAMHEALSESDALRLAASTAAACLADPSPSAGVLHAADSLKLGNTYGFQETYNINKNL